MYNGLILIIKQNEAIYFPVKHLVLLQKLSFISYSTHQ